jgi:hypothetical protein
MRLDGEMFLFGRTVRMTTKEWRETLLSHHDEFIFEGFLRKVKGKNIGAGVVEVSPVPLVKSFKFADRLIRQY